MPILGVIASSISGNLYSASYDSIATTTVGAGGASSVTFSSIPAGYTHLQIRVLGRTNRADITDWTVCRFNSDSSNNYSWHYLRGNGSFSSAGGGVSQSYIDGGTNVASTGGANMFGVSIIDIFDYNNANKFKTVRLLSGENRNGAGFIYFQSGLWQNTNAITSITLTPGAGTNWSQYSSFALYGMKVA